MSMQVWMLVTIDGDDVKPEVGVNTAGFTQSLGAMPTNPPTETVRRGLDVASKVLGFAEGLKA